MTGLDLPLSRIPLRSHPITQAPALMPRHTMNTEHLNNTTAPSPGAAAAEDQATVPPLTKEELARMIEADEASRKNAKDAKDASRRRNAVTVSLPDELAALAKSTGRDPEHLAQSILAQQAPILAARAAEALKAVLP